MHKSSICHPTVKIIRKWSQEQVSNVNSLKRAILLIRRTNEFEPKTEDQIFNKIKFEFTLIKNYLQMAASKSQFAFHDKALELGSTCLSFILKIIRNISKLLINVNYKKNYSL